MARTPREWVTEMVVGVVIALLVRRIRHDRLAPMALSRSDVLTGLLNRRTLAEAIEDDRVRARRSKQPLSLVCLDLDNFKQINNRAGHGAVDLLLQQLAVAIGYVDVVRHRFDREFRLGGDEFASMLPGRSAEQAEALAARIEEHRARLDPVWVSGPLAIGAGIDEFDSREAASDFIQRADAARYRKKRYRVEIRSG